MSTANTAETPNNNVPPVPPLTPPPAAPAAAAPTVPAGPPPIEALRSQLQYSQHVFQTFAVTIPAKTKREDVLTGDFWVLQRRLINAGDEIRVIWEDGSAVMDIICVHSQGRFSQFRCRLFTELNLVVSTSAGAEHNLEVKNRGAAQKWCVVDTKTGEVYKKMLPSQEVALREMNDLIAARGR